MSNSTNLGCSLLLLSLCRIRRSITVEATCKISLSLLLTASSYSLCTEEVVYGHMTYMY